MTIRPQSRQERWRARNPLKSWAHSATRSAIRRGLIVPKPCEVCGDPKAEAHHPDYRRPLVVKWWCRRHHKQHHHGRLAEPVPGDLFAGNGP
jgi:hypothetical protein